MLRGTLDLRLHDVDRVKLMRYYVMEESKDKRQQDFDFSDWTDYSPKVSFTFEGHAVLTTRLLSRVFIEYSCPAKRL